MAELAKKPELPVKTGLSNGHNAVKLNDMPWFHGKILRDEAENLLLNVDEGDSASVSASAQPQDGVFLVRESTNFPGDYTLCVVFQQKVEHYRQVILHLKLMAQLVQVT